MKKYTLSFLLLVIIIMIASTNPLIALDINVPDDYGNIQDAINASSSGDVIIVQPGTYYENINFPGKAITLRSTDPNDPNIVAATIINGNRQGSVARFNSGEDANSIISGFTIENGSAVTGGGIYCYYSSSPTITNCIISRNSASYNGSSGGGIYCNNSNPTISDCTISGNSTSGPGGGIYCNNSYPTISDCTISGNSALYNGDGIYCSSSGPTIINCTISGSSASGHGCGIYCTSSSPNISPTIVNCTISGYSTGIHCHFSSPAIINCTISGNSASDYGGGIFCHYSYPTISDCTISENSASGDGGGIYCYGSSPTITNCTISKNLTSGDGGGIYCDESSPTMANCTISGNSASDYGGGIFCDNSSSPTIANCTLSRNSALNGGGISCFYNSSPIILNCILWNDKPNEIQLANSIATVKYSNIQGKYPGKNNIAVDPLFIDSNNGDFRLDIFSPCIDKGDPNSEILKDKDDITRPQDGNGDDIALCDMGAYEHIFICPNTLEACDGTDNDCDQKIDEDFDADGDGFSTCGGDCNDQYPNINPSAKEIKNGIDDDCDNIIDEGCKTEFHIYQDLSGDFSTIQEAIYAVEAGDTIIVHPGNYYENIDFWGKEITLRSIDPNDPNIVADTIIDGNNQDSVIRFQFGEDSNSIISGFYIKNGNAEYGGGIYCCDSSPTIANCTINGNSASDDGGGIHCHHFSSPTIANCTISENSASGDGGGISCIHSSSPTIVNCTISKNSASKGGGIYYEESSPTIVNCTISDNFASDYGGGINCTYSTSSSTIANCTINKNSASQRGGGIHCHDSSPTIANCILSQNSASKGGGIHCRHNLIITDCIISQNSASDDGGGIYCAYSTSSPTIASCILSQNSASDNGGGICCNQSSPTITSCTINQNSSPNGGGIHCDFHSSPTIANCIISQNSASDNGGGFYCEESSPTIANCTISENSSSKGGGFYCFSNSSLIISSCILWNDKPVEFQLVNSTATVKYSNIQGRYPGKGNIEADPLFIDSNNGDFRLDIYSPCIDKCDPNSEILKDKDDITRPQDGNGDSIAICDMGAYEHIFICPNTLEVCDGIDNDCDQKIDEDFDADGDGFSTCGGDFNDQAPNINPSAKEIKNGIDDDCDNAIDEGYKTEFHIYQDFSGDFSTIQEAIYVVEAGDTIIVHPGTYYENIDFWGKAITLRSMDPNEPNIVTNTIIDGNSQDSVIRFQFGEDANSIISGFYIKNGNAEYAGGIYCYSASPTIANCTINKNSSSGDGGGIFCYSASPTITNCTISENSALGTRYVSNDGGGIYCYCYSNPTIANCTISENSASDYGGGIFCEYFSSPTIKNCTISENSALTAGGGIYSYHSNSIISNCIISGNSGSYGGGGIHCYSSSPTIANCTISKNSASDGSGIYFSDSSPTIANCTISKNSASSSSGIYCIYSSKPTITNCILWNDSPHEIFKAYNSYPTIRSNPKVTYSDIRGSFTGEGNIDANPLFIDPNMEDFHLNPNSPCIDAGDPNSNTDIDKDGRPRPLDGNNDGIAISDMGAYEYDGLYSNGSFKGSTYNIFTKNPLNGIEIKIGDLSPLITGEDGAYSLTNIPIGSYDITFSKNGFHTNILKDIFFNPNQKLTINVGIIPIDKSLIIEMEPLTAKIKGIVYSSNTGDPLPSVNIKIIGEESITTDENGSYYFENVSIGPHDILYQKAGFQDNILRNIYFMHDKILVIDLELKPYP